jgi:Est1 DNA/RNA binding domain
VQLGDLSRYRATEIQTDKRNWGPAVGYYNKATILNPADGRSYNQLAVLALNDQDHLRVVYNFYRSICVETPHPQAQGNLELEFKKLRAKSKQGKLISENPVVFDGSPDLYNRFLLFHARCMEVGVADQEDRQKEILQLLKNEILQRPEATILRKFSLINLAAEKSAAQKAPGAWDFSIVFDTN